MTWLEQIQNKLTATRDSLRALLIYANNKTQKYDPDIGEAIKTLVDGYGGGDATKYLTGMIQRDSTFTSIYESNVTSIGSYAFYSCRTLTSASFPNARTIWMYAFYNCTALTTVSFPKATAIGDSTFYGCSALTSVSFPVTITIGNSAFRDCTALTTASFPNAGNIGMDAFYGCSALTSVSFPNATGIGSSAFYGCSALTSASFPKTRTIGSWAFYNCTALTDVYIGASKCTLATSSAFLHTMITASTGSIYVRPEYVETYKSSAQWSYFKDRIFPVEE